MRSFQNFRKSVRGAVRKWFGEPDIPRNTTGRKQFVASYVDIMNLHSAGTEALQDASSGLLVWVLDYDALP